MSDVSREEGRISQSSLNTSNKIILVDFYSTLNQFSLPTLGDSSTQHRIRFCINTYKLYLELIEWEGNAVKITGKTLVEGLSECNYL